MTTAVSAPVPASAAGACGVPTSVTAGPDTSLDTLFTDYGNSSTGWTGADGPHSVSLPDGRNLWFFDDTFLGTVSATGNRARNKTPYLHNSIVVQDAQGALSQTLYTSGRKPSAFLNPVSASGRSNARTRALGYWPGGALVEGNTLYVVLAQYRFRQTAFSFLWQGDYLASLSLPSLTVLGMVKLPATTTIDWSELMAVGSDVYVYGFSRFEAYVAKAPGGDLTGPWQYFDGTGWTSAETGATPIGPASGGYSVSALGGGYAMVTMASGVISVAFGCSASGPFSSPIPVYASPEASQYPASFGVITYDAHAQPAASSPPGDLVVSYDVNAPGSKAGISTASLYRPRYVTLTFGY